MSVAPVKATTQVSAISSTPRYKSYAHIILIAINLGLSNFYFGYSLVYISTIEFKEIMRIFSITMGAQTARGILTGCIPVGAGIGALLGRRFIHIFSRRKFVLFINALAIIAGSVIFVNNMVVFIIMRLIQGICVGMYTSIIPLYTNEISPVQIESSTAPFTQIFCSSGTTIAYLFYYILSVAIEHNPNKQDIIWYLILGFPLIPLILQTIVLLFVFPYETPKYLLLHHHKKKARELIADIYKPEFVQIVFREKVEDLEETKGKNAPKKNSENPQNTNNITNQVISIQPPIIPQPPIHTQSQPSVSNSQLSGIQIPQPNTPKLAIFAAIHLMILRQFSGVNAVVAYGGDIISKAAPNLRAIVPIFLNFEIMLGAIVAIYILHKIGKKKLLQIGTMVLGLSLMLITVGFFILDSQSNAAFVLVILGLIIFTITFGLTYGAIIWAYVSQIVQPSYDIFATMITWVFASIVIILFPILKNSIFGGNPSYLFLFFCIWLGVSFFINQAAMVETKDKTEHQIREEYMDLKCEWMCCKGKTEAIELIELTPKVENVIYLGDGSIGRNQNGVKQVKTKEVINQVESYKKYEKKMPIQVEPSFELINPQKEKINELEPEERVQSMK